MKSHYVGDDHWNYFEHFGDQLLSDDINAEKALKINKHLAPASTLLDFGCSAGRITRRLNANHKAGVEVSKSASAAAREAGIEIVDDITKLDNGAFDAVVSHHALEHLENPLEILRQMHRVLVAGGQLVLVVPSEVSWYKRNRVWRQEVNKHLYTWTPLTLGNLVEAAGFRVETAKILRYEHESRFLGRFNRFSVGRRLMGLVRQFLQGETEILLVAYKSGALEG